MGLPGFTAAPALGRAGAASSAVRQIGRRGSLELQARISPLGGRKFGGGGNVATLGYTCESESNSCTCSGILDCDKMRKNECKKGWNCWATGCTCTWK